MTKNWTLEGAHQGQRPLDKHGNKIPRDQLTWFDSNGDIIWDPSNPGSKPFHETVTYEHKEAVVDHWNREGRNTDRAARNDFYNDPANMEAMDKAKNVERGRDDGGAVQPGDRAELLPAPDHARVAPVLPITSPSEGIMDLQTTLAGFPNAAPLDGLDQAWRWSLGPVLHFAGVLSKEGTRLLQPPHTSSSSVAAATTRRRAPSAAR
ncbi:hypothetical protein SALBM217S_10050 [Streptomyces griseoloalbus]